MPHERSWLERRFRGHPAWGANEGFPSPVCRVIVNPPSEVLELAETRPSRVDAASPKALLPKAMPIVESFDFKH
jgi:hypothetical protein